MSYVQQLPKLSASRSRAEFFKHLGWREDNEQDKRLYQLMMEEAAHGRARTCQDPTNLTPQSRHLSPPYSASMITETAKHREVQTIYWQASQETKGIYNLGIMHDGTTWDNWIIRWCLWHVFRYRDDRNRNRGTASQRSSTSSTGSLYGAGTANGVVSAYGPGYYQQAAYPYDPVRDC